MNTQIESDLKERMGIGGVLFPLKEERKKTGICQTKTHGLDTQSQRWRTRLRKYHTSNNTISHK